MPKLDDTVKAHIVQALACYDTPSVIVKSVKEEFGLDVTLQQVEAYDPNKRAGKDLSEKWRTVFEETRKRFLSDVTAIPIANRAYRLRVLQRMTGTAESMRNLGLVSQLLEQAAKETGDAYTNKHRLEHTGKDGGPIQNEQHFDFSRLTDEQLRTLRDIARSLTEPEAAG